MANRAIADASTLIKLSNANALSVLLDLLNELDYLLILAEETYDELKGKCRDKIDDLLNSGKITKLPKIEESEDVKRLMVDISIESIDMGKHTLEGRDPKQHKGEAFAIYAGKLHNADIFISDDVGANRIARKNGFRPLTHLAIVDEAVDCGAISGKQAINIIKEIENCGHKYNKDRIESYFEKWL